MKLKVMKPFSYFERCIPSGKQKRGSKAVLICLVSSGYFSNKIGLKVCYNMLFAVVNVCHTSFVDQVTMRNLVVYYFVARWHSEHLFIVKFRQFSFCYEYLYVRQRT
jgi:hypothetical protein